MPAVLRARRGLRPRGHPDPRAKQPTTARWRLTGQKVWTTNAQHAAFGLLLARTDADVPKHKGLTMFIVPMDAPGVDDPPAAPDLGRGALQRGLLRRRRARPRRRGRPGRRRLGRRMTTLMFERVAIGLGGEGFGWRADRFADALLADEAATRDREVRHRFGEIAADFLALRFTGYRMLTTLQRGGDPRPRGRARQGHDDQGRDRGGRAARRRARPRRALATSAWASSSPTCRASSRRAGRRRSCATWSASACSACRRSRASTRASRSPSCAPRSGRRLGPPA